MRCKPSWGIQIFPLSFQGKVEMEMSLLTADEADKKPAGRGREEPDPLHEPK